MPGAEDNKRQGEKVIGDLLYACPLCKRFDAIVRSGRRTICSNCGAHIERRGRLLRVNGRFQDCAWWFDQVAHLPGPHEEHATAGSVGTPEYGLLSKEAVLRQAIPSGRCRTFAGGQAELERMQVVDEGRVALTDETLEFIGQTRRWSFPWQEVTCVTTDAHYFVFKVREKRCFQVRFLYESPLKWERLCRQALVTFWRRRAGKEVFEFQPHITFGWPVRAEGRQLVPEPTSGPATREPLASRLLYNALKMTMGLTLRALFAVGLEGRHHVPSRGPFILVINHEGYLDSFFTLALLPRKVAYLAKNTEFKNKAITWLLRQVRAIPVRRHEIDPSVVRNALRVLAAGEPVGIFVEGERTWDGRPLPPKVGTVRLLLRAGVPIVPVLIQNSLAVLPRWDSRPQRHRVRIKVGAPFRLAFAAEELPAASAFLMQRIFSLGGK